MQVDEERGPRHIHWNNHRMILPLVLWKAFSYESHDINDVKYVYAVFKMSKIETFLVILINMIEDHRA